MKIVMVTPRFFPEYPGGTEIYCLALGLDLQRTGANVAIVAPKKGITAGEKYRWEGVDVFRYPDAESASETTNRAFAALIEEISPDVVHFHHWGGGFGFTESSIAIEKRIPLILTLHHSPMVCPRGTGIRWGLEPCKGPRSFRQCAACVLHSKGLPIWFSLISSPLRLQAAHVLNQKTFRAISNKFSAFIIHCNWMRAFLSLYSIPEDKIHFVPQALCHPAESTTPLRKKKRKSGLLLGFLGRCKPIKGADLAIQAVRSLPCDCDVRLHLHLMGDAPVERQHLHDLKKLAQGDPRISFLAPLESSEVIKAVSEWDAMVVPSRFLETGPLTVLDAFAAGIPVIGARCGGIPERIEHEKNGLLFNFNDFKSLAVQIKRLVDEEGLLHRLSSNIPRVPSQHEATSRMNEIYENVIHPRELDGGHNA